MRPGLGRERQCQLPRRVHRGRPGQSATTQSTRTDQFARPLGNDHSLVLVALATLANARLGLICVVALVAVIELAASGVKENDSVFKDILSILAVAVGDRRQVHEGVLGHRGVGYELALVQCHRGEVGDELVHADTE